MITLRYRPRRPRPRSITVKVAGRRVARVRRTARVRLDLRRRSGVVRVVLVGRVRRHGRTVRRREVRTVRMCG